MTMSASQERRFKEAEKRYKLLEVKIDKGMATVADQLEYVDAKNAFFGECERILSEMLKK